MPGSFGFLLTLATYDISSTGGSSCCSGRAGNSIMMTMAAFPGSTIRCNAGNLAPSAEGSVAYGPVLGGGQAMAAELEMLMGAAVSGEEALRVPRHLLQAVQQLAEGPLIRR